MHNYRAQLEAVIGATVFHSSTTYSWFGQPSPPLPPAVKSRLTPQTARSYLLSTLQFQLYNDFYCRGFATPVETQMDGRPMQGMTQFNTTLSEANTGQGYWEAGWELRAIEQDQLAVYRNGLELRASREHCLTPPGVSLTPGMQLRLRFPKEFLGLSPGFYMALGNAELSQNEAQLLVRHYWHLSSAGGEQLVRSITTLLNGANCPFRLKVVNDPARFTRCDAAVLYTRKSDYPLVAGLINKVYPVMEAYLKSGVPAFTKPLARGLGLAEDPGPDESFGMQRCRLLADGLIRAYEQGKNSVTQRLHIVENCFNENGINIDAPFLNPGSRDEYPLLATRVPSLQLRQGFTTSVPALQFGKRGSKRGAPPLKLPSQTVKHPRRSAATATDRSAWLQTAYTIGVRLCEEALWHGERCTWLGEAAQAHSSAAAPTGAVYSTLGPEIYSGTSGVALFLAELYGTTGDAALRRAALGSIQQALSRVKALAPPTHLGLYTGVPGIAFTAARVGALVREEKLVEQARQLLRPSLFERAEDREFDLLSGIAGAIVALLALHAILNEPPLLAIATRLGDELLRTAVRSESGHSWKSIIATHRHNLVGFSHGAAGAGFALLELFQATGDTRYCEGAQQAFNYERHWFNADIENWPRFDHSSGRNRSEGRPASFSTFWCHGAPGITLSRLRAYELLGDAICKDEAITGLRTTVKLIDAWLRAGYGNYSLCHGLAGNADVLLYAHQVLGQELADAARLVDAVAHAGVKNYAQTGLSWPCGSANGETPGLMLGLAGIGYFYLRLYNSAVPSILIVRRECFRSSAD